MSEDYFKDFRSYIEELDKPDLELPSAKPGF